MAALSSASAGDPAAIQGAFQGAADRTVGYAQGMTGALGEQAGSAAQEAAASIAAAGAPGSAGVTSQAGAIANTLNYTGGYIPGSSLAFEAANRMAEATAFGKAQQGRLAEQAMQQLRDSTKDIEELRYKAIETQGTIEGEKWKRELDEREMNLKERAFQVQVGQLQLANAKSLFDQAEAYTNLTGNIHVVRNGKVVRTNQVASGSKAFTAAQAAETSRANSARSAATSRANAAATNARIAAQNRITNAMNKGKFGLSQKQYELAVKKEERIAKGGAKTGGFTNLQKQEFRGTVNQIIRAAEKNDKLPREVVAAALSEGVPYSTIVTVMRNYARANKKTDWLAALNAWQR